MSSLVVKQAGKLGFQGPLEAVCALPGSGNPKRFCWIVCVEGKGKWLHPALSLGIRMSRFPDLRGFVAVAFLQQQKKVPDTWGWKQMWWLWGDVCPWHSALGYDLGYGPLLSYSNPAARAGAEGRQDSLDLRIPLQPCFAASGPICVVLR